MDVWSLGCVLAELHTGDVLFPNESVVTLLAQIVSVLGPLPRSLLCRSEDAAGYFTRSGLLYAECDESGGYDVLLPKRMPFVGRFPGADTLFLDFLLTLLAPDPEWRPTAMQALEHPWLSHAY